MVSTTLTSAISAAVLIFASAPNARAQGESIKGGAASYTPEFFSAAQPANALDMLDRLPGFAIIQGEAQRGLEGAGGNVLINGQRPTTKADDLDEVLRRIPASRVARIELYRGSAPGLDMQGHAALANVILIPGSQLQGLVELETHLVEDGRNLPGVRFEVTGGDGVRTWEASARQGYVLEDGGPGVVRLVGPSGALIGAADTEVVQHALERVLTGAYQTPLLGGKGRVNGRLLWSDGELEETSVLRAPAAGGERVDESDEIFAGELGANLTRDLGSSTAIELTGLYQFEDQDFISQARSPNETTRFALSSKTTETIGRLVVTHALNPRLTTEVGAEGALNTLRSSTDLTDNGLRRILPAANVEVAEQRGEVFAKGTWRQSPALTLDAGLRFEASNVTAEGDVQIEKALYFAKPRFGVTWQPTPATQVRLGLERVIGQLDFTDFVASAQLSDGQVFAGNPDLDPEQAWVAEAAVEQQFWGGGVVALTARHSALTHVLDRAPVFLLNGDVFDRPQNIGDGTRDELILEVTLPFDRLGVPGLQVKSETVWTWSEVTDPTTGRLRDISGSTPIDYDVQVTHDLPQWRLTWGFDLFGGSRAVSYRYDQIEYEKTDLLVRAHAEWRPRRDLSVRLEVENLLNRSLHSARYRFAGARGSSPVAVIDARQIDYDRSVSLRVRKTFGG